MKINLSFRPSKRWQSQKLFAFTLIYLVTCLPSFAQQKYTISGSISDATNGEELIGASVLVKELGTGGITNVYGFYSVTIAEGEYNLMISYVGYEPILKTITLNQSITLNIELQPQSTALEEVVVTAEREDLNVQSTQMSVNKLDMKEIENVPVLFGEKDIIKTIQLGRYQRFNYIQRTYPI